MVSKEDAWGRVIGGLIGTVIIYMGIGWLVAYVWNWAAGSFKFARIDYWVAVAISLLVGWFLKPRRGD